MMERNAIMGGEESGGFGFSGHIPERDAILAGLFAVDLMVERGGAVLRRLDYLVEKVGNWYTTGLDVTFNAADRPDPPAGCIREARYDRRPFCRRYERDRWQKVRAGRWVLAADSVFRDRAAAPDLHRNHERRPRAAHHRRRREIAGV